MWRPQHEYFSLVLKLALFWVPRFHQTFNNVSIKVPRLEKRLKNTEFKKSVILRLSLYLKFCWPFKNSWNTILNKIDLFEKIILVLQFRSKFRNIEAYFWPEVCHRWFTTTTTHNHELREWEKEERTGNNPMILI